MLANRLKILLAERDLTIKDTVDKTGISRNTLSNIVNNPYANVSTANVNKLCNFLNVAPDKFYDYFPWNFSRGYALREKLPALKASKVFAGEVGNYLIKAQSGSRVLRTSYGLHLSKGQDGIDIEFIAPSNESFEELYGKMSPLFQHTIQRAVEDDCLRLVLELNDVWDFRRLFKKDKIPLMLALYLSSGEFNAPFLFGKRILLDINKKKFLKE